MISVKRKVRFVRRPDKSRALVMTDEPPTSIAPGRVPRISRLMALAIHFDKMIRDGKVSDQSDLARLAHVTQPRMTQIEQGALCGGVHHRERRKGRTR